jgi:hypothetical protein
MGASGLIGNKLNHAALDHFYFQHPTRIWRHARTLLPIAFSLRPEWRETFGRVRRRVGQRETSFPFQLDAGRLPDLRRRISYFSEVKR